MSEQFRDVAREAHDQSEWEELVVDLNVERAKRQNAEELASKNLGLATEIGRNYLEVYKRARASEKLDHKTGLLNYPAFVEHVVARTSSTARQAEKDRRHGLILADLDDFKTINEILGYQSTDDTCLLPTAGAMQSAISRSEDAVARFGGEEFVVFLYDTDLEGTEIVADKIRQQVNAIKFTDKDQDLEAPKRLGVSMALTVFHQGDTYLEVFDNINEALQEAKQIQGKNQTLVVD